MMNRKINYYDQYKNLLETTGKKALALIFRPDALRYF